MIQFKSIATAYSFNEYLGLVNECSEMHTTTGIDITAARIEATKINSYRMNRIYKQVEISTELSNMLSGLKNRWKWIVLTEAWCGDSAQNTPVIAKIAEHNKNIDLKFILRDENPAVMNQYLTNGARAIPKLICIDAISNRLIGTWGPRPTLIQEMASDYKKQKPNAPHDEFVKNLHLWYAKDKTNSIQKDFIMLLPEWLSKQA